MILIVLSQMSASLFGLLLALIFVSFSYVIAKRNKGAQQLLVFNAPPLAFNAPRSSRSATITESLVLAILGAILLLLTATTEHTNGLVLILGEQSEEVVRYSLIAASLALLGYLVAIVFSVRGQTLLAVLTLIVVLSSYGYALKGSGYLTELRMEEQALGELESLPLRELDREKEIGELLLKNGRRRRSSGRFSAARMKVLARLEKQLDPTVIFNISNSHATGADLWVNDIYLGKTPVRIKLSKLLSKIPNWEEEPKEDHHTTKEIRKIYGPDGGSKVYDNLWTRFTLPKTKYLKLHPEIEKMLKIREAKYCYARVELDGQPGISTGGSGGGGSGSEYRISTGFRFPHRETAIEKLLDQARLKDYQVTEKWFQALEEYGIDGWYALRNAIPWDKAMDGVLNRWASWKYSLDDVKKYEDALDKIYEIAIEADDLHYYSTASVAGCAVELVAERLRPTDLIPRVEKMIKNVSTISWGTTEIAGEKHYQIIEPNNDYGLAGQGAMYSTSWKGSRSMRSSDLVIAHAVWCVLKTHRQGSSRDDQIERVRDKISAALIRQHAVRKSHPALRIAAYLGSAVTEKYLLRKARRVDTFDVGSNFQDMIQNLMSEKINRWWYLAAHLQSPGGQKFRQNYGGMRHTGPLLHMADRIVENINISENLQQKLGFLFLDNELEEHCIAREYWPRFQKKLDPEQVIGHLHLKVSYLIAAEPAFDIEEYKSAWREAMEYIVAASSLPKLRTLPLKKRIAVLDALGQLQDEASEDLKTPRWANKDHKDSNGGYFYRHWKTERYSNIDDTAAAEHFLAELRSKEKEDFQKKQYLKRFEDWLKQEASKRPVLLKALCSAPEAELRRLSVLALQMHPSLEYRNMIDQLCNDEDESVRKAAENVREDWKKLAAETP